MFRMITERAVQYAKGCIPMLFRGYVKAFDKVHHNELLELLGKLYLGRILEYSYWEQNASHMDKK